MTMIAKLDHAAMQADRDAGMRVAEIAKKHNCNVGSVYNNTKAPAETPAKPERAQKNTNGRKHRQPAISPYGTGDFSGLLMDLRRRRDALDRAIAAIEEI